MLHYKFRGNRSAGSGEEDFWRVFTIYGRGGHLGHVTRVPRKNFRSPYPSRLHITFGFVWPHSFREEDVWKCERTDGHRTQDHGYTKSSPVSLPLRWAKNTDIILFCFFATWLKIETKQTCMLFGPNFFLSFEPRHEKTNVSLMRKQRRRSALQ